MQWRKGFLLVGLIAVAATLAGAADKPAPFPDFTFHRVKPPKPGATHRITVQITPPIPQAPDGGQDDTVAAIPRDDSFAWFWAAVSPEMSASAPSRLAEATLALDKGPADLAPRLQILRTIADTYGSDILKATIGTKVSPALVLAVIGTESSGRATAVSYAGAIGLMQLMPATAERFGVSDPTDPAENIRGGVAYLDWLMKEFGADPVLVLAGYNSGENAVKQNSGVPPFAETRAYVPKVLAAWKVARGLCLTPPELITDGCAFAARGIVEHGQ